MVIMQRNDSQETRVYRVLVRFPYYIEQVISKACCKQFTIFTALFMKMNCGDGGEHC